MIGNLFPFSSKDSSNGDPSKTSNLDLPDPATPIKPSNAEPLAEIASEPSDTSSPPSGTEAQTFEQSVLDTETSEPAPIAESTPTPVPETKETEKDSSEIDALRQELADIKAGLSALQETFEQKIKTDTKKNEQFDRLHEELQDYRNGTFEKTSDAIALEIIRLIDELGNDMAFYAETAETDPTAKALQDKSVDLRQELLDILYRQGIEPYQDKTETLDSHRQTNVQTVITEEPEKHRTIAERLSDGYEKNGRVIRKERVKVYRAVPPKTE